MFESNKLKPEISSSKQHVENLLMKDIAELHSLENIAISVRSRFILKQLLDENPELADIFRYSINIEETCKKLKNFVTEKYDENSIVLQYYRNEISGRKWYNNLRWKDFAAIRILDYIDNEGREFTDLNLNGEIVVNRPVRLLWLAINFGIGGASSDFFRDMLELFHQFSGKRKRHKPSKSQVLEWMERHPDGLNERIINIREQNKERILRIIIRKIEEGEIDRPKFRFKNELTEEKKLEQAKKWWEDSLFHLQFAIRDPDCLNEMLNYSLSADTMKVLHTAQNAGIPFFINPYYLSLLNITEPEYAIGSDLSIRAYIIYSHQLVEEFGNIVAWEKEDIVEPGKPNAAGWLLPSFHNVHRRYPEVAILIPDTVGRACGGLCASCQRMYDFQSGHLNFDLEKLSPRETWDEKLVNLMKYYEDDAQLRDILITGGDALMSSDISLEQMLDAVYEMAKRKRNNNAELPEGEKKAEILRIRLGTRLPVYIPQRINENIMKILSGFKEKAAKIGVKQFVIQTHFESAMEITPESKLAIKRLLSAGWIVTNQLVFTATAARRGHTAKLRKVLNDIGVLTYYTFSVKGYKENSYSFATNARAMQEQIEEKVVGTIPENEYETISHFAENAQKMTSNIARLKERTQIPFLATDRNVLNLPGVGKSLTFRTIGITKSGRRILEFEHDATRTHSPIINKMGKVAIIESKSIYTLLKQFEEMGEDLNEYESLWGYSIGETEPRMPIYDYPKYEFAITDKLTNLQIED